MAQVFEGTWEEIERHKSELIGRQLRVTVKRNGKSARSNSSTPMQDIGIKKRLDALNAWLTLPRPEIIHTIDDSRTGIYGEDEDRG